MAQPAPQPAGLIAGILQGANGIGGAEVPKPEPTASQIIANLMFKSGDHVRMLTRLTDDQIESLFLMIVASRITGYKRLEDDANLMMELLVSKAGLGRTEGAGMSHAYHLNPPMPAAIQRDPALGSQ